MKGDFSGIFPTFQPKLLFMLGIDNIKTALKTAADLMAQIASTKKVNFWSAFGFTDDIHAVEKMVKNWQTIAAEWHDRDEAEVQEIREYAIQILKIPDGQAQDGIQYLFDWAAITCKLVAMAKEWKKK